MQSNGREIKLEITLYPDGRINVNGPLEDKIFCLGLMDLAKDAIYKFEPSKIVKVPPNLLAHLGPNGNS